MVFSLKFSLRTGVAQLSKAAWMITLHLHSELRGEGFTLQPLLDKIAENATFAVVAGCVSELVQRQRRDLLQWVIVPCGTVPLHYVLSQILWKDLSVSQFAS